MAPIPNGLAPGAVPSGSWAAVHAVPRLPVPGDVVLTTASTFVVPGAGPARAGTRVEPAQVGNMWERHMAMVLSLGLPAIPSAAMGAATPGPLHGGSARSSPWGGQGRAGRRAAKRRSPSSQRDGGDR